MKDTIFLRTGEVCRQLDIPEHRLRYLIRSGQFTVTHRDSSGRYVWLAADVARLKGVLRPRWSMQEYHQAPSLGTATVAAIYGRAGQA